MEEIKIVCKKCKKEKGVGEMKKDPSASADFFPDVMTHGLMASPSTPKFLDEIPKFHQNINVACMRRLSSDDLSFAG